jgi:hypothetical protein
MGLRLRLRANVDISHFSPTNRVILTALKRYGMIVADNGSNWFLSGAPDDHWNNDDLHALGAIPGSDFEVINTSSLQVDPDSGQVRGQSPGTMTPLATANASETPGSDALTPTAQSVSRKGDANSGANISPLVTAGSALAGGLAGLGIWLLVRRRRALSSQARSRE